VGGLRNRTTQELRYLQSHTLVGRSPSCSLRLDDRLVSGEHAVITWHEDGWRVRDLGSRNGTFANGERLSPSVAYLCHEHAVLAFGDQRAEWELDDATAPSVMLVPFDGGAALLIDRGILRVPHSEQPLASIHQGARGEWLLEQGLSVEGLSVQGLSDGALVVVGGRSYRFHAPECWIPTESFGQQPLTLETSQLCFRVSQDEENVELDIRCGGRCVPLGRRAAYYLLLTLARIRLEQRDSQSAGWVHWSELASMLRAEQTEINLWVYRIRERFAEAGFTRPGAIIERRSGSGQLRIGAHDITIGSL